jgi:hypothetical protein
MTRGQALVVGMVVLALGALGYLTFRSSGLEGYSAGIATSLVLMLVVLGWTASYLLRVVKGDMTYMEQRRRYRTLYDAHTTEELQRKFEQLSPQDQEKLLAEFSQLEADADM